MDASGGLFLCWTCWLGPNIVFDFVLYFNRLSSWPLFRDFDLTPYLTCIGHFLLVYTKKNIYIQRSFHPQILDHQHQVIHSSYFKLLYTPTYLSPALCVCCTRNDLSRDSSFTSVCPSRPPGPTLVVNKENEKSRPANKRER